MIGGACISPSLEAIPESAVYDEYPAWTAEEFLDKAQRRRKMLDMRRRRRYWGRGVTDLSTEEEGELADPVVLALTAFTNLLMLLLNLLYYMFLMCPLALVAMSSVQHDTPSSDDPFDMDAYIRHSVRDSERHSKHSYM